MGQPEMEPEIHIKGVRLKALALVALAHIGAGTTRQVADKIALDFGYEPQAYWNITGAQIAESLTELQSTRWGPSYIDGIWISARRLSS